MLSSLFTSPLSFIFSASALIIAIAIHEFAHAYVADRLGDPTPRLAGRLTLNPLAHLDPLGTLALLLVGFGWGKPVPFDPFNLSHPRRDSALISLAGPISNILLAIVCSLLLRLPLFSDVFLVRLLFRGMLQSLIVLNCILAVFNLLPIYPLDGFKVVEGILPQHKAHEWAQLSSYGIFFLIVLLLPLPSGGSLLHTIIDPPLSFLLSLLLP